LQKELGSNHQKKGAADYQKYVVILDMGKNPVPF
jgi:hypothetical protein